MSISLCDLLPKLLTSTHTQFAYLSTQPSSQAVTTNSRPLRSSQLQFAPLSRQPSGPSVNINSRRL